MKFTFFNKLPKVLCIALILSSVSDSAGDEPSSEQEQSSSSQLGKLTRYHAALLKSPKRGRLFEKFCQSWIDLKSDKELSVFLKSAAKKGDLADLKLLAYYQLRSGLDSEAQKTLILAIEKFKKHPELIVELAKLEANSLNFDKATHLLKQAQDIHTDDGELKTDITKLLGKYLARAGKTDAAVVEWNRLIANNPNDNEILEDVTQLFVSEGMFTSALKVNQQLIDSAAAKKSAYKKMVYKLEKAELTKRSGNANEAVEYYEEILTEVESDSWIQKEILIRVAAIYVRDSKALGAFYERACKNHSNSVLFRQNYADHLASFGETDKAGERYLEIIKIRPQDNGLKEDFIDFLCSTNQHLKAKQIVEALIGAEPRNQSLYAKAIVVYDHLNERKMLLQVLEKINQLSKQSETRALLYSQNLARYSFGSEATTHLENSIQRYPKTFKLRTALASRYLKNVGANDQEKAIKLIRSAAAYANKNQLMELTGILRSAGKNDIAYELINEQLDSYKTDHHYLIHLSELALSVSQNQPAQDLAYTSLLLSSTNSEITDAAYNFINIIYKTKTIDTWLAKLSDKDSPTIPEMSLLAHLYWDTKVNDLGQQVIDKLLLTKDVTAFTQVVKIYEQYRLIDKAIDTQELLINLPNGVGKKLVHIRKMVTLFQSAKMYKEALVHIKLWQPLSPNDKNVWLTHVDMLKNLDKKQEALNILQKSSIRFPDDYDVSMALAQLHAELNNTKKALSIYWRFYHEAVQLEDKISIGILLYEIYNNTNQVPQLIGKFDTEIRLNPKSTHAHLCLAYLYEKTASFTQCREHLTAASSINPEDESILIKIAKLDIADNHLANAEKMLKKLIVKNSNAEALNLLGKLYLETKNYDKASQLLVENNKLNDLGEIIKFAVKLIRDDEFEAGLKVLNTAPPKLRGYHKVLYLSLLCHHQLDDHENVLRIAVQINQLPDVFKVAPVSHALYNPDQAIPSYPYHTIPGYSVVSVFDNARKVTSSILFVNGFFTKKEYRSQYQSQVFGSQPFTRLESHLATFDLNMAKACSILHLLKIENNLAKPERDKWVAQTKDVPLINLLRVIHSKDEVKKSRDANFSPEFFEKIIDSTEQKDLAHAYILLPVNIGKTSDKIRDEVLKNYPDKTSSIYKKYLFTKASSTIDVDEILEYMERFKLDMLDYEIALYNLQPKTVEQQARAIVILESIINKPNLTPSQSLTFNDQLNKAYAKTNAVEKALGRVIKLNTKTTNQQRVPTFIMPNKGVTIKTIDWPVSRRGVDLSPVTVTSKGKEPTTRWFYSEEDILANINVIKSPIMQVHLLSAYELYSDAETIIKSIQGQDDKLSLEWFKLKVALYGTHKKEYLKAIKLIEARLAHTKTPAVRRELSRNLVAYGYEYKLLHPKKKLPESCLKTLKSLKNIRTHDFVIYEAYGLSEKFPQFKTVVKRQSGFNSYMGSHSKVPIHTVNRKKIIVKNPRIIKINALLKTGVAADAEAAVKLAALLLRKNYKGRFQTDLTDLSIAFKSNDQLLHKLCEGLKPKSTHFNECFDYYQIVERLGGEFQKKQAVTLMANSTQQNAIKLFKLAIKLYSENKFQATLLFSKLPNRYTSKITILLNTSVLQTHYFKHRIAPINIIKDKDILTLCNIFIEEQSTVEFDPEAVKSSLDLAHMYLEHPVSKENALRYILKFSPELSDDQRLKLILKNINLKKTGLILNRLPFQYRFNVVQNIDVKVLDKSKSQVKRSHIYPKGFQYEMNFDSYLGLSALDHFISIVISKKDKSLINLEQLNLPKADKELLENILMISFFDTFLVDFEKLYDSEYFTDKEAYRYISYIHSLNPELSNKVLSYLAEKFISLENIKNDRQIKIILRMLPAIAENHAVHGKADQLKPAISRYLSKLKPDYSHDDAQIIQTLVGVPEYTLTLIEAGKKNLHITPEFDKGLITVDDPEKMIILLRAMGLLTDRENFPWMTRTAEESKALMAFNSSHNKKKGIDYYYSVQYSKRLSASPLPILMNTTPHEQASLDALLKLEGKEKFGATIIASYRNSGLAFLTCIDGLNRIAEDLEKLTPEQKKTFRIMFDFASGLEEYPEARMSESAKALGVEPEKS